MKMKILLFSAFLIVSSSGCVIQQPNSSNPQIERVSHEDQMEQTVSRYPTAFSLPSSDSNQIFKRFDLFLKLYVPESQKLIQQTGSGLTRVASEAPDSIRYQFIVESRSTDGGTTAEYAVRCLPLSAGASSYQADLNAKNLARFLVEGTLERSLLQLS